MAIPMRLNRNERIGVMRHRVTIEQYTTARDSYGQEVVTFASLATVWAHPEYQPVRSGEDEMAAKVTAKSTIDWTMRYRNDVEEKMRLVAENGDVFDILSINPDLHREYMVLETQNVGIGGVTAGSPVAGPANLRVFRQTFTGITTDSVTVTDNDGNLPANEDNIMVFWNGQFTDQYTVSGSTITFGVSIHEDDFVTVQWWV